MRNKLRNTVTKDDFNGDHVGEIFKEKTGIISVRGNEGDHMIKARQLSLWQVINLSSAPFLDFIFNGYVNSHLFNRLHFDNGK